jgi:hypothetical protein
MRNSLTLGAAALLLASLSASADAAYLTVHVETSSSRQAMIAPGAFTEDFSGTAPSGDSFASTFGGTGPSAVFQGFSAGTASGTGTAFGTSAFATASGAASVKLDRTVKYFGYRAAALDGNNTVELFSRGTSLGFFNLVGNAAAAGAASDPSRLEGGFTYVNVFSDTAFDEVRFTQSAGSFALDDVRVNQVAPVPETGLWALMILGFGALGAALRFRAKRVRVA